MSNLFRIDALNARREKVPGTVVLIRPPSFAFLTAISMGLAVLFSSFLFWGSLTRHTTISGQLVPNAGLIKVYAPQRGVVIESKVKEGQLVSRGSPLLTISVDRHNDAIGDLQKAISGAVISRRDSLLEEMRKTKMVQGEELSALKQRVSDLEGEITQLNSEIQSQKKRVRLADENTERYQGLLEKNYVSKEMFQQKEDILLDQRARLQGLERDLLNLELEMRAQKTALLSLPIRHQNDLAKLEREITGTAQELAESEDKRSQLVTAPSSGVVSMVSADIGQSVQPEHPLLSIVPTGSLMQAHLYAPSKAMGFLKEGDLVRLRYQSYPYERFGQAEGVVGSISRVALQGSDLNSFPGKSIRDEPLYKIIVDLHSQTIDVDGQAKSLQAGMLLEADILQETKHLYEWILEPLMTKKTNEEPNLIGIK